MGWDIYLMEFCVVIKKNEVVFCIILERCLLYIRLNKEVLEEYDNMFIIIFIGNICKYRKSRNFIF